MRKYSLNCVVGRGWGEIPKGGRAGRARSLGLWPRGGRSQGIWPPGGRVHGGLNPWDTGITDEICTCHNIKEINYLLF